jgi:hypothetical protein
MMARSNYAEDYVETARYCGLDNFHYTARSHDTGNCPTPARYRV